MPIDLTKQRHYTTRIPDSRYPYGAFNTSYQNGVFTAILRDDLVAGDVYMRHTKEGAEEDPISYEDVKWFVAFFIYDDARVMQDSLCIIEEIVDPVAGYTKSINDIPYGEFNLKWNIYGVMQYNNNPSTYHKRDYVYNSNNIYRAKQDSPSSPSIQPSHWTKVYDCSLQEFSENMQDFMYDLITNPYWTVVPDFVEGDEIDTDPTPDTDLDTTPFEKIACGTHRINLSNLAIEDMEETSNCVMYVTPYEDFTSEFEDSRNIYILSTDLDENGYYEFTQDDGIYIVSIVFNGELLYQDYIFCDCALMNCYDTLLQQIYCNDVDCCTGCSDEVKRQVEFRRNELNKLEAFIDVIAGIISSVKVRYTGSVILESNVHQMVEKANMFWQFIEEIIARCGTCGENVTINTGGCTQCN
jgi:hypothetical protein